MDITVDTSQFDAMCNELSRVCAAPPDRVLREEIGRVLSKAIEETKAADIGKIRQHSANAAFSLQPTTLYAAKKPRRKLRRGKVLYNLKYKYPDALWKSLQSARAVDLQKRLHARGLAKQSWYILGQMLGIKVDAPQYVVRAKATTGKTYQSDEQTRTITRNAEIGYEIRNSQPTVNALDGQIALARAINGRVSYFMQNVAHDVFNSLQKVAKKYPGVT